MLRRLAAALVALCCLVSAPHAQTQADIAAQIATTLPDNKRGVITASAVRAILNALNVSRGFNGGRFDARLSGALGDDVTDDSGAIKSAFQLCYAAGGGEVVLPPTGKSYRIATGIATYDNACGLVGVGVPNWPGPSGTRAQWTARGSWVTCEDTQRPCLDFHGSGFVRGVNFWNNQPEPSATPGTPWAPLNLDYTVAFRQNFSRIEDCQFANVSRGVIWAYTPASNIGGTYSGYRNLWMGSFYTGLEFDSVNDTMSGETYRGRLLWHVDNPNVIDWLETQDSAGFRVKYLDNAQFVGTEFYKVRRAIAFTDGTAAYGTGTITRAATNLQFTDTSFNQVVQAIDLATGDTSVSAQFNGVLAQSDTDTNRAAPYFFNLASNRADVAIRNIEMGYIGYNVFAVGGGVDGRLRLSGWHLGANLPNFTGSGYGYLNTGTAGSTHGVVLNKGSKLTIADGIQDVQPGPYGGSVIACGQPASGQPAGSNCGTVVPVVQAVTPTSP